jgi:hypothetical protein
MKMILCTMILRSGRKIILILVLLIGAQNTTSVPLRIKRTVGRVGHLPLRVPSNMSWKFEMVSLTDCPSNNWLIAHELTEILDAEVDRLTWPTSTLWWVEAINEKVCLFNTRICRNLESPRRKDTNMKLATVGVDIIARWELWLSMASDTSKKTKHKCNKPLKNIVH